MMSIAQGLAAEDSLSLGVVLKACGDKTIVFGTDQDGKPVQVGEQLDGYCRGVLEGTLATLSYSGIVCPKEKSIAPEYLLSVVLTYQDQSQSQDDDAAAVIGAALKRAFRCDG